MARPPRSGAEPILTCAAQKRAYVEWAIGVSPWVPHPDLLDAGRPFSYVRFVHSRSSQPPTGPPTRISDFQRRVYETLRKIPRGRVTTYADLARAIGCRSPRAVGQALRRNPFAPFVPCHRVIASDGRPGGFEGRSSGPALRRKLALLAKEDIRFIGGRMVDPWRILRWPELSSAPPRGAHAVHAGSGCRGNSP